MNTPDSDAYTLINIFTPKHDALDELLELQLRDTAALRSQAVEAGWLNNEVYRSHNGQLIVVTRFRDAEAQARWAKSSEFRDHLERIGRVVEKVHSFPVDHVARHGDTTKGEQGPGRSRLAVIIGSTREGRFADKPADWISEKAAARGFDVEQVDLRDFSLPFFGDPVATAAQAQATNDFAKKVSDFDAYVFLVAEYNHAPTAVLKNALDHADWRRKPAALVGYGGVGGARAVEHVRGIAAELEMVTMQTAVHILYGDYRAISKGEAHLGDFEHLERSATRMLDQLAWWNNALARSRGQARTG